MADVYDWAGTAKQWTCIVWTLYCPHGVASQSSMCIRPASLTDVAHVVLAN